MMNFTSAEDFANSLRAALRFLYIYRVRTQILTIQKSRQSKIMIIFKSHESRFRQLTFLLLLSFLTIQSCDNTPGPPRVLVFSKTKGWKHSSIPFANAAIRKMGEENK